MACTPFRPAREIAIEVRRIARDDPANYDNTPSVSTAATPSRSGIPPGVILDTHPGQPRWWPAFTKTMIAVATAGVLIIVADLHVLGGIISAASVAVWGLARITAFYGRDLP